MNYFLYLANQKHPKNNTHSNINKLLVNPGSMTIHNNLERIVALTGIIIAFGTAGTIISDQAQQATMDWSAGVLAAVAIIFLSTMMIAAFKLLRLLVRKSP